MAEISFKSVGTLATDPRYSSEVYEQPPIGLKSPVELGTDRSGLLEMHFDPSDQVHDNFRNLVLANWGDRLGRYHFGANLRDLCSERTSREDFDSVAMLSIKTAVERYMPFIDLQTFESSFEPMPDGETRGTNIVNIKVVYNVVKLRIRDRALEVSILAMG